MGMKLGIINQARMTSTRLPGKVMLPVQGRPLLDYQLERLQRVRRADLVILATTTNATDDVLADFCARRGIACHRGPEDDVLTRFYDAARAHDLDLVVRVTSDCPVIDPAVVDAVIEAFLTAEPRPDYFSNTQTRSFPRGMDTEVFTFAALAEAHEQGRRDYEREHVTPFLYGNPDRFRIGQMVAPEDQSQHRWTVDTPEDFELIRRMIEALYPQNPEFTLADCLALFDAHPEWMAINAHVRQKALGE